MKIERMKVADLILSENNVRIHPELQIKELQRSLHMFGQTRPIVADENNHVLIGKGLVLALLANETQEADIYRITGLSEEKKKKLMLSDNKIFNLGMDDFDSIDRLLGELREDLEIPGFDEETLKAISYTAEQVTEKLSEYGTLDQERIEQIRENGRRKEEAIRQAEQQQLNEWQPDLEGRKMQEQRNTEQDEGVLLEEQRESGYSISKGELYESAGESKRFVICPKCGEKIWL